MFATLAIAGCSSPSAATGEGGDKPTIGFVNISMDTYGTCLQRGMEAGAEKSGAKLLTANSNLDPAKELSNVEDMISRGVDAIVLQTVNVDALAGGITKAQEAGIPLYLTAVLPESTENITGAAVVDLAGVGGLAAGWIGTDAGSKNAKVALISGVPGAASDIMMEGFKKGLPASVSIVSAQPGMYNRGKAQDVAENVLQANPDLDYFFVQNEDMAFGARAALESAGKTNVKIVTSNGTDEGLKAIEAGTFSATVADSAHAMGLSAMNGVLGLLENPTAEKITKMNVKLITKENVSEAPAYCG